MCDELITGTTDELAEHVEQCLTEVTLAQLCYLQSDGRFNKLIFTNTYSEGIGKNQFIKAAIRLKVTKLGYVTQVRGVIYVWICIQ